MSDRFYTQMVESTGWAPGYRHTSTLSEFESKFGKIRRKEKWLGQMKLRLKQ